MEEQLLQHIQSDIPLSELTTIQLGGIAAYSIECTSTAMIREALAWAKDKHIRVFILGGGSNIVFPDEGFDGLVIRIKTTGIIFGDSGMVRVAAGEIWDDFVQQTLDRGLAGVECLSGIPGLVGATPMQNVGAYGQEVAEVIHEVVVLNRETLEEIRFSAEECGFGYRSSRFKTFDKNTYIIVEVIFQLNEDGAPTIHYPQLQEAIDITFEEGLGIGKEALKRVREVVLGLRKKKSMLVQKDDINSRSCGSFFVNPIIPTAQFTALQRGFPDIPSFPDAQGVKVPAAWLIEQAGFSRGYEEGGIGISPNHALALVNYGGTTKDLLHLAKKIQTHVEKKFGIHLSIEPEVVMTASFEKQ